LSLRRFWAAGSPGPGDHRLRRRDHHLGGRRHHAGRDGDHHRSGHRLRADDGDQHRRRVPVRGAAACKYGLQATLDGFQTYKRDLNVELGRTVKNDFVMTLGAITDVIEVTGEAPLVDVTSTSPA